MNVKMKQIAGKITVGAFAAVACFSLLANVPAAVTDVSADSGVEVNEENFPDEYFRNYVSERCDTDHDNNLSSEEINERTSFFFGYKVISSLKGIEYCFGKRLL